MRFRVKMSSCSRSSAAKRLAFRSTSWARTASKTRFRSRITGPEARLSHQRMNPATSASMRRSTAGTSFRRG